MSRSRSAATLGVVAVLLSACGDTDPAASTQPDLTGAWELSEGTGPDGPLPSVDGYPVTLTIDDDQAGGISACNHYGGTVARDGDSIRITELFGTDMGCEPPVMELESAYLAAIQKVEQVARDSDTLTLSGPSTHLEFVLLPPVPTADLVGTTWVLETLLDGELAASVGGDPATLMLEDDGALTGSTGCRELTGRYVERDGGIDVTELAARDDECPDDLWAQDNHVVTVIGDGFRPAVEGETLTLTSQGGLGLVYRARTG